jgi:mannosyltransferase
MLGITEATKRIHWATFAPIAVVFILGAWLRFHNLGSESLWLDEAVSWTQAKDGLAALIQRTAEDNYPPLNNLALFVAIKFLGTSEWSVRLPSAIFGLANIGIVYWLGTMTVGRKAALIGTVLLALSPFHVVYSQEARMYSLLSLATTLYAASCLYYIRSPSILRSIWISLSGLVLVYSHPYGELDWLVIALAFAAFFLLPVWSSHRTILVWVASNTIVAVGFTPWGLILAEHAQTIHSGGFWIPPLTTAFIGKELGALGGGRLFFGITFIGAVLGVIGEQRRDVVFLCAWVVIPVVVGIIVSILWQPMFLARYVIGSHPPLLLLSGFGWTKYAKDWRSGIFSTAVVAAIALASLPFLRRPMYAYPKDDWRSVASFLDTRLQTTGCVLVVPTYEAISLGYYKRHLFCELGAMKIGDLPVTMPASAFFGVFSLHSEEPGELSRVVDFTDELRRRGWRELYRTDFQGIRVVSYTR